jgi:ABC-type sugar transport system permease subunit
VVSVRVFNYLIARDDIGAASAQALVLAGVLIVLVTIYFRSAVRERAAATKTSPAALRRAEIASADVNRR